MYLNAKLDRNAVSIPLRADILQWYRQMSGRKGAQFVPTVTNICFKTMQPTKPQNYRRPETLTS